MPLDTAVYVPGTPALIVGAMGPVIVAANPSTGTIYDGYWPVSAPAEGPCDLAYLAATDKCYLAVWNAQRGLASTTYDVNPKRDIFEFDPHTLLGLSSGTPTGTGFGLYNDVFTAQGHKWEGPMTVTACGGRLYFSWAYPLGLTDEYYIGRVDPTNPAASVYDSFSDPRDRGLGDTRFDFTQADCDGTYYYLGQTYQYRILRSLLASTTMAIHSSCGILLADRTTYTPTAVCYCPVNSKVYFVCGSKYFGCVNSWGGTDYSKFNLDLITSGCTPFKIRYSSNTGKLYLPSQNNDTVIVWDPNTDTGVAKTGFDGPVDVVVTTGATPKVFAVQSGPIGLRVIT